MTQPAPMIVVTLLAWIEIALFALAGASFCFTTGLDLRLDRADLCSTVRQALAQHRSEKRSVIHATYTFLRNEFKS